MKATQELVTVIRDETGKICYIISREKGNLIWSKVKPAKEEEIVEVVNDGVPVNRGN